MGESMLPTKRAWGRLVSAKLTHAGECGLLHGGVADDPAALVHLGFAGLELWFHECDQGPTGTQQGPDGREHRFQRDERKVHHDGLVGGARQGAGREMAGVDLFEVGDARIGP
jgi:hypothetical protein